MAVPGLPPNECSLSSGLVPNAEDQQTDRQVGSGGLHNDPGSHQGVLVSPSGKTRPAKDSVHDNIWPVPVPQDAIWTSRSTGHVPENDGQGLGGFAGVHQCLSG